MSLCGKFILTHLNSILRASCEDSPKRLGNYLTFSLSRSQWTWPKSTSNVRSYTLLRTNGWKPSIWKVFDVDASELHFHIFGVKTSASSPFILQWEHVSSLRSLDLWAKWPPHIHHRQSSHPRMLPAISNPLNPLVHTQGYPAPGTLKKNHLSEGAPKNGFITKCKQVYPRFHCFRSLNQVLYLHRLYPSPISVAARWEHVSAKHRLRKLPPEHGGEQQLGRWGLQKVPQIH